jgi:hypothetical protein
VKACRKCRDQFGHPYIFVLWIVAMVLLIRWIAAIARERFRGWVPESFR